MKELFLLKLGEIVWKGQNRRVFEDKLENCHPPPHGQSSASSRFQSSNRRFMSNR